MPFIPVIQSRSVIEPGWYYEGRNNPARGANYVNGYAIMSFENGGVAYTDKIASNRWRLTTIAGTAINQPMGKVAYGSAKYVVPSRSTSRSIYYATNIHDPAASWTAVSMPSIGTATLTGCIWDSVNNQFVAYGTQGYLATSPDGITWTSRTTGTSNTILAAAVGAGLIVIVGSGGIIRTSPTGVTWTGQTSGTAQALNDIGWNGVEFVAVGISGADGNEVRRSTDGTTWSGHSVSGTGFTQEGVAWASGLGVWISVGGATGHTVQTSPTGVTWSAQSNSPVPAGMTSAFRNYQVLSDGSNVAIGSEEGAIYSTSDFSTYSFLGDFSTSNHLACAKFLGNFYGLSNLHWMKSAELRNWVRENNSLAARNIAAQNSSMLLVLGSSGLATMFKTTDGTNFNTFNLPNSNHVPSGNHGCIWVDALGLFICVSSGGRIATSPDGETWTERATGMGTLHSVVWTGSQLVATGAANSKVTSADGITWSSSALGITATLTDIIEINGVLVALNSAVVGGAARSTNGGTSWSLVTAASTPDHGLAVLAHDGDRIVALGTNKWAWSDDDGATWQQAHHSSMSLGTLNQFIYDEDTDIFLATMSSPSTGYIAGRRLGAFA